MIILDFFIFITWGLGMIIDLLLLFLLDIKFKGNVLLNLNINGRLKN